MEGGQPDQEGGFPRVRLIPCMLIFNFFQMQEIQLYHLWLTGPSSLPVKD